MVAVKATTVSAGIGLAEAKLLYSSRVQQICCTSSTQDHDGQVTEFLLFTFPSSQGYYRERSPQYLRKPHNRVQLLP